MLDFIRRVKNIRTRIAVVGDIILDEFHFSNVPLRVSPESPGVVFTTESSQPIVKPGGAGNLASQFKFCNTETFLLGITNESFEGINTSYCVKTKGFNPRKIRFYDSQQMPLPMRWDIEVPDYGEPDIDKKRLEIYHNFCNLSSNQKIDVVVLSNYNKGVFNEHLAFHLIEECQNKKIPVVVDPKCNPSWWKGCTIFKPNAKEAKEMTGLSSLETQASHLQKLIGGSIVITSPKIISILDNKFSQLEKTNKQDVSSVVGAGDCFAAILSLAMAHGLNVHDASKIAFEASSEYVKSHLNHPITPYELLKRTDSMEAKLVSADEFRNIRNDLFQDKTIVFTNGCWDLLHDGHLHLLQEAKSQGKILVVGVNDDKSVVRLKGVNRPIMGQYQRSRLLASLDCVDFVIVFSEDNPYEVIKTILPTVLVKGDDYADKHVIGEELVKRLHIVKRLPHVSTTNIINKITS